MHRKLKVLISNSRLCAGTVIVALSLSDASWAQLTPPVSAPPTSAPPAAAAPAAGQPAPADGEQVDLQKVIETADLPKIKDFALRTEQLMQREMYDQALAMYMSLSQRLNTAMRSSGADKIDPASPEAYELSVFLLTAQGRALAGLKEDAAALQMFATALEQIENFTPTLIALGQYYLDRGDPYQGRANFEKALQSDRNNIEALVGLGKSLAQMGNIPPGGPRELLAAVKPLTRVIDQGQNPLIPEAYKLRGASYGGLFMFDKALADMEKAIAAKPDDYENYFELGLINMRKEDYAQAVEAFAKSVDNYKPKRGQEDEPYLQGPLLKVQALIEVGKKATDESARQAAYQAAYDECQQLLGKLDEKSPLTGGQRAAVLLWRGIAERMLGKMGTAIRTLSQAIELNPSLGEAYFRRGICLQQIGENRMAVADFTQAATINYTDPRGNLWEGFVYAKLGNYYEAIRAYGDAIAASDRYTPAYVNRGLAYMALGENEKAVSDFNDALRIEPTNGDYYYKRGVAYVRLNQLDKAKDSLATAIEFDPSHREAYRYLADVLQKQGHANLADEYRKKASELEKKPSAP